MQDHVERRRLTVLSVFLFYLAITETLSDQKRKQKIDFPRELCWLVKQILKNVEKAEFVMMTSMKQQ